MLRTLKCSVFLIGGTLLAATTWAASERRYVETFDGPDKAIMLNGTVDYGVDGAWSARIDDGALELENTDAGSAVRYYTTPTVSYPGSGAVSQTDGASIEVDVRVDAQDRSGAGLLGGFDPRRKDYHLFAIGPNQQIYVMFRENGKARLLVAATNDAVKSGQTNRLRLSSQDDGLAFEVNGVRVITIAPSDLVGRGIGIGAFGRGTFSFDNVHIIDAVMKTEPASQIKQTGPAAPDASERKGILPAQ